MINLINVNHKLQITKLTKYFSEIFKKYWKNKLFTYFFKIKIVYIIKKYEELNIAMSLFFVCIGRFAAARKLFMDKRNYTTFILCSFTTICFYLIS